jgi:hypothetical protein
MYLGQDTTTSSSLSTDLATAGGSLATGAGLYTGLSATAATGIGAAVAAAIAIGVVILGQIGQGRREADAIVPVQNAIGDRLAEINRAIPAASIPQLQGWHTELINTAAEFRRFVADPRFTDGRASHQALETLMPLIDGTDASGYPCELNAWGNPCNGGTLGTVERQIISLGGIVQPPQITQGSGMGPTLQSPLPGLPYLPQSGYIAPTSPLSTIRSAGVITVGGPTDNTTILAAGAAVLLIGAFLSRRGR